ncbi:MAG TPA: hypothetical protein VG308_04275 [Stellaceae bacterium]|jgi:tetratricopeptide (TPR) repeat protein|nr:hypothetical protein [Stellaceae bacterium]
MSWRCLPGDNSSGSYRPRAPAYSGGGNRAAAAGAGAIASIIGGLASMISTTDANNAAADVYDSYQADRARKRQNSAVQSREANRQAMAALQQGRFDEAQHLFQRASDLALNADDPDGASQNTRNAAISEAQLYLQQGLRAEQRGDLSTASNYYMRANYIAGVRANAEEFAKQIAAYNDRLIQSAGGAGAAANRGINDTQTQCEYINTKFVCH